MEEWRADHSEVQNFPLPLVCSQTFMIQEEQKENCLTHDHALVHTAFSFYSHQKSRIKYFLVKKKKKKKRGNIAPFWNVRAKVSVEAWRPAVSDSAMQCPHVLCKGSYTDFSA